MNDPTTAPENPPAPRRKRWFLRIAIGLIVAYAIMLLVLTLLENRLLYLPKTYAESWMAAEDKRIQDVWLTSDDGTKIHAWWAPVENPQWHVLYFHGNAGNLSHRQSGVRRIQKWFNASVLIIDYPGYGKSEGSPSEPGCYAAARASYRWLLEQKAGSPERIVLLGISLGAAVAVDTAVHERHGALILLSPFLSVPDVALERFPIIPARWLCRNRFDNWAKLPELAGPLFIAHGVLDDVIPISHGRRLYDLAGAKLKRFLALEDMDHGAVPDEFYAGAARFLQELAPVEPSPKP